MLGLEYKWWNTLPPNMETTVLSGINFEYKGMAGTWVGACFPQGALAGLPLTQETLQPQGLC